MERVASLRHAGTGALVSLLLISSTASATQPLAVEPPHDRDPGGVVGVPAEVVPAADPAVAPEVPDLSTEQGMRASPTAGRDARLREAEELDIPAGALSAYRFAARTLSAADPACRLDWSVLAAIGKVESDHGRHGGAELGVDGVSDPLIRGVALDGRGPVARVADTDEGRIDDDARWDRAVGPMQFLPSTWVYVGVDADGDDVRSADDLDDAALGAAVYLCAGEGDLRTRADLRAALLRYNPSDSYVEIVTRLATAYADGEFEELWPAVPDFVAQAVRAPGDRGPVVTRPTGPGGATKPGSTGDKSGDESGKPKPEADTKSATHSETVLAIESVPVLETSEQAPAPTPEQAPEPEESPTDEPVPTDEPEPGEQPAPAPPAEQPAPPAEQPAPPAEQPTPAEEPEEPQQPEPSETPEDPTTTLVGALSQLDGLWLVGETVLDVGDAEFLAALALADLDADGVVETNLDELTGLAAAAATETTFLVLPGEESAVLLAVGELPYREE